MSSFLQTQKWAEFQKALGAETFFVDKTLVIKYKLPLSKNYLYVPRLNIDVEDLKKFIHDCRAPSAESADGARPDTIFIRIEPEIASSNEQFIDNIVKLGFTKVEQESQPSKTLILDITKSEDDLLAAMRPKTRYNIRIADKRGIEIKIEDTLSDEEFERLRILIKNTAKRDNFTVFSGEYYKKLLKIFGTSKINPRVLIPYIKVFLAKYQNQIIAASIIMFCGDTATYLHGASNYEFRRLMAPYLLQWQAILEAKKLGCSRYDFWGIDEKKWPGVTRFKSRFGGGEVEYIGTWDYVFRPIWYYAYRLGKKLK